jgi:hypothetical protein
MYCKTCKYRNEMGTCHNGKISEDFDQPPKEAEDMLIYSFQEGGYFWAGERFGCVHHVEIPHV